MGEPVMTAKLAAPSLVDVCDRPRLYRVLDEARQRPIVWVTGPAGSGKSTLLASYARARDLRCLWYDVDLRDHDTASLFYYLARAAENLGDASEAPLPLPASEHAVGSLGFARRFFEALFRRIEPPGILVFDNCHLVSADDRWFAMLREGLAAVPEGITVLLASRSVPPPGFARFLASSRMAVLGWADLRFSPDEAAELIAARAGRLGLTLSAEDCTRLQSDCGGWAAGIVLALERARTERCSVAMTAPEAWQQIFDYFAAEVLAHVDPEIRMFLTTSALLPYMTGPALDRLLGFEGSSRLIVELKSRNFFITEYSVPAGYRYHPLFREFLLSHAHEELGGERIRALKREAAVVLAEMGEPEAALELFVAAGALEDAGALVVNEAPKLIEQGRAKTVMAWAEKLPAASTNASPWLSFWAGMAAFVTESGTAAVARLRTALELFDRGGDAMGFWTAWCALVQAEASLGEDYRKLLALVELARARRPAALAPPSPQVARRVDRNVAIAVTLVRGDDPQLATLIERALGAPCTWDPEELQLAALGYGYRGEMDRLLAVLEPWRHRSARQSLAPAVRQSHLLAEVIYLLFSGEFERTLETARQALRTAEEVGFFVLNDHWRVYALYAAAAIGDAAEVALLVDERGQMAESGRRSDRAHHAIALTLEALLAGDRVSALRHAETGVALAHHRSGTSLGRTLSRLLRAELLWRCEQVADARRELADLVPRSKALSHILGMSALMLDAGITLGGGDAGQADELLAEALALGARWGIVPVPCPSRALVGELCGRAVARGIKPAYAKEVARKFGLPVPSAAASNAAQCLPGAKNGDIPTEYGRAVREALRHLHETGRLTQNPLLMSSLVARQAGTDGTHARVSALRKLLRATIATLGKNARTVPMHRALHFTYVEPAPTQPLAADAAGMPFGTYRRHLTSGLKEIAATLWLQEQPEKAAAEPPG